MKSDPRAPRQCLSPGALKYQKGLILRQNTPPYSAAKPFQLQGLREFTLRYARHAFYF